MGIRQKIMLGFFALGILLFFSGLMSFFELNKLSSSTQSMLDNSVKNMELSKTMLDAVQDQNTALLQIMVLGNRDYDSLLVSGRRRFDQALGEATVVIRDLPGIDSIYAASLRYNEVVNSHFSEESAKRGITDIEWFVNVYKTSYYELTTAIKNFMISSQNVLDSKAIQLENNAYRAIMPGVIALAIAILIIVMFFYLMDIYYINPVLQINKGLQNYLTSRIPFHVTMEGRDEVYKLKENVEALIEQLKARKTES